jgi:hypothetical protein
MKLCACGLPMRPLLNAGAASIRHCLNCDTADAEPSRTRQFNLAWTRRSKVIYGR